jgi:hypothetical protein
LGGAGALAAPLAPSRALAADPTRANGQGDHRPPCRCRVVDKGRQLWTGKGRHFACRGLDCLSDCVG